jgi:hypothetical protein
MTLVNDSLGAWEQIGTITPSEDWQIYPESIVNLELFRFTCFYNEATWNDPEGLRSFGILRFYYPTPQTTVSQSFKLFVKPEPQIIQQLIPIQLKNAGVVLRDIGVKRIRLRRRFLDLAVPQVFLDWSLKVEALI